MRLHRQRERGRRVGLPTMCIPWGKSRFGGRAFLFCRALLSTCLLGCSTSLSRPVATNEESAPAHMEQRSPYQNRMSPATATGLFRAAETALEKNEPTLALEKATKLVATPEMEKLFAEVRLLQARACVRLGRLSEAVLFLDDLITHRPSSAHLPSARCLKGYCLLAQAKRDKDPWLHGRAFRSYRRAATSASASPEVVSEAISGIRRCLETAGYRPQEIERYIQELTEPPGGRAGNPSR